jgi:hypothetical protein
MEEIKRWSASIAMLAALVAAQTQAAAFDERMRAPHAASSQALRPKLKAHFDTFHRKQQEQDPAAFIRDKAAHKQWSDLYFAVRLAMDERTPLGDLSTYGLKARPDGGYVIDLRAYPQWEPLDARLSLLNDAKVLESYVPALLSRGFRAEDIAAVRRYIATHDPRSSIYAQGRQLVETFAKRLQAQRQIGQSLSLQEALAYRYQKESLKAEAERQWAVGLLDTLDRQRQRILASFLDEFQSQLAFGPATEPLERTLEQEVQPIVSGEYAQILNAEEAQLQQEIATRAEQLMEGERR